MRITRGINTKRLNVFLNEKYFDYYDDQSTFQKLIKKNKGKGEDIDIYI